MAEDRDTGWYEVRVDGEAVAKFRDGDQAQKWRKSLFGDLPSVTVVFVPEVRTKMRR